MMRTGMGTATATAPRLVITTVAPIAVVVPLASARIACQLQCCLLLPQLLAGRCLASAVLPALQQRASHASRSLCCARQRRAACHSVEDTSEGHVAVADNRRRHAVGTVDVATVLLGCALAADMSAACPVTGD